jgi:hypothetical protein
MPEPKIKYLCPVCERQYDTPEEAENCLKPIQERFKPGDIIRDIGGHKAYLVKGFDDKWLAGGSLHRVEELITAENHYLSKGEKEVFDCWMIGGFWCRAEKYPVKEAKELVKRLKKRLVAAEKFLEMVKACQ